MKRNNVLRQVSVFIVVLVLLVIGGMTATAQESSSDYAVVDTKQDACYDANTQMQSCPGEGAAFYGQDALYTGLVPNYTDNGDGTITDNNTGLMWQKDPVSKMTFDEAVANASSFNLAGYTDWRLPTIKELYSLICFNGTDPSGETDNSGTLIPFIDTDYFVFYYGDTSAGERIIDSQWATSTKYVYYTMGGNETMFGVNFADGRIKGYPITDPRTNTGKGFYVIYVRGGNNYGVNQFVDNNDGTITDTATGLMWMKQDSGHLHAGGSQDGSLNWQEALAWAENLDYAGYSDWRLPNAKELQSIVDYTRSPATTNSPAIDPIFETTSITDEGGSLNYPFFWTGTTHVKSNGMADSAVYIAFGEALGWLQDPMTGTYQLSDVHGAGAQRCDPKSGDPSIYPYGHGPQGDVVRIYNYVRCVRGASSSTGGGSVTPPPSGGLQLTLDQSTIDFKVFPGRSIRRPQKVMVMSSGEGTLNWTAGSDSGWLSVRPSSGSGNGVILVSVDSISLSPGTYSGAITVSSADAANSPQTVQVNVQVFGPGNMLSMN